MNIALLTLSTVSTITAIPTVFRTFGAFILRGHKMTVITRLASGLILADQTVVRATLTFSLALLSIFIFGYLQEKPIKARCALILGTNSTFRLSASDTRPLIITKPETELTFFTDTFLKTISTVINSLVAFLLTNR